MDNGNQRSSTYWGGQGNFIRPVKEVVSYYQDKSLHGRCLELKDMDAKKQSELVKYYSEKYFKVKGKTTRVPLGKGIYKDYLLNRTYYRVWRENERG